MENRSTPLRLSSQKPTRLIPRDIAESLGKLPPQDIQMEQAVLGALLSDKNALINIAGTLKPEHLYSEQHQEIYSAMLQLFSEGSPIDLRSVAAKLKSLGKLELIGGGYYLAVLTTQISSSANIEFHSRILIELSIKRSLILIASTLHHDAYEDTVDAFELYGRINMHLQEVLDNAISNRAEKSAKELSVKFIKEMQDRSVGKHGGIPTGFPKFDQLTDGLHKTDLILIAARPSVGKSLFAVQIGKQVAEQGHPVGIFSLEMSSIQLIGRLNIAESQLDASLIKKGNFQPLEFERLLDGAGKISTLPIWIDDTPALSIVELRARAIRMKTKYGVKLIILDYVQLVKVNERNILDQEIGVISRTLKIIAKELEIPVIALSQLSRDVEKRGGDKRPVLSDLRSSGSLEQDCDMCCFLYRPEMYHIRTTEDGQDTHGLCEVIIAKHRQGALDTIRQKFIGSQQRFTEWEHGETYMHNPSRQSEYIANHVKNPLPSERTPEQLQNDDNPF